MTLRRWFICVTIFWLEFANVLTDDGCYKYALNILEPAKDCDGFDNKEVGVHFELLIRDDGTASMTGKLDVNAEISDEYEMNLGINKETGDGSSSEKIFTVGSSICASLKDDDCPWCSAFHSLGITKCPIETGVYESADVTIDLAFMDEYLNRDYVAAYAVDVELNKMGSKVGCYSLGIEIYEESCDKK